MACLYCTDGCQWCEPAEAGWPPWFTPASVKHHRTNVLSGLHPFGFRLGPEDQTCGRCAHRYVARMAGSYHNCRKIRRTGGPGTDVRMRWRACEHFELPTP